MVAAAATSAAAPVGAWLCWAWCSLSIVVDGCDDPILLILFIHPATVHLLQLPEGSIVQASACQHDQEAVSQYPLVVSVLMLPQLWSLMPHTMKPGPALCIGR